MSDINELVKQVQGMSAQCIHAPKAKKLYDDIGTALQQYQDAEIITAEWQDKIRGIFIEAGVPDGSIDGAGGESGSAFDFTEAEICQGVNYFVDEKIDPLIAAAEYMRSSLVDVAEFFDGMDSNIMNKLGSDIRVVINNYNAAVVASGSRKEATP